MARRATAKPTPTRAADPEAAWEAYETVCPPPVAPPGARAPFLSEEVHAAAAAIEPEVERPARPRPSAEESRRRVVAAQERGVPFAAELDVCELDERERPGVTWSARARELSRSSLTFRSRRMCYVGRLLLVAVHLIDDHPAPLFGEVTLCDYEGEGEYEIQIGLLPVPQRPEVHLWLEER